MISKEEFISFCKEIIPEEEMTKYKKKTRNMWITLSCVLIAELIAAIFIPMGFMFMPMLAIISVVIIVLTMKYNTNEFKGKYSHKVLDCLLKGYSYTYNQHAYIDSSIYKSSGFGSTNYDSYTGEDFFKIDIPKDDGSPSGTYLSLSDLHITRQETYTDSQGRRKTRTVTLYDGILGYVRFPFGFKCDLSLNVGFWGKEKIKLEDIKFNKKFRTYTNNQLEALVILTPTLMTKLVALEERVGNLKLSLTEGGFLYLGISNELFKINKPNEKAFEHYYNDISNILGIVNEIKNNNKVFKM